ncbi:uncharacterized protein LOC110974847 [Acanthaster planci]|uniref:Uncharacterized protein LOC110974847 n=1 Tax=Acanthaster planci TaxID=133434 RepID=A0A8B7XQJ5_ACAPL|nr:uncharacterized protein LOC110974847 [Acanthaster planci]
MLWTVEWTRPRSRSKSCSNHCSCPEVNSGGKQVGSGLHHRGGNSSRPGELRRTTSRLFSRWTVVIWICFEMAGPTRASAAPTTPPDGTSSTTHPDSTTLSNYTEDRFNKVFYTMFFFLMVPLVSFLTANAIKIFCPVGQDQSKAWCRCGRHRAQVDPDNAPGDDNTETAQRDELRLRNAVFMLFSLDKTEQEEREEEEERMQIETALKRLQARRMSMAAKQRFRDNVLDANAQTERTESRLGLLPGTAERVLDTEDRQDVESRGQDQGNDVNLITKYGKDEAEKNPASALEENGGDLLSSLTTLSPEAIAAEQTNELDKGSKRGNAKVENAKFVKGVTSKPTAKSDESRINKEQDKANIDGEDQGNTGKTDLGESTATTSIKAAPDSKGVSRNKGSIADEISINKREQNKQVYSRADIPDKCTSRKDSIIATSRHQNVNDGLSDSHSYLSTENRVSNDPKQATKNSSENSNPDPKEQYLNAPRENHQNVEVDGITGTSKNNKRCHNLEEDLNESFSSTCSSNVHCATKQSLAGAKQNSSCRNSEKRKVEAPSKGRSHVPEREDDIVAGDDCVAMTTVNLKQNINVDSANDTTKQSQEMSAGNPSCQDVEHHLTGHSKHAFDGAVFKSKCNDDIGQQTKLKASDATPQPDTDQYSTDSNQRTDQSDALSTERSSAGADDHHSWGSYRDLAINRRRSSTLLSRDDTDERVPRSSSQQSSSPSSQHALLEDRCSPVASQMGSLETITI